MLFIWMAVASAVFSVTGCACAGGFTTVAWMWMLPAGFAGSFLVLLLLAFLFLLYLCKRVDQNVEQEKDDPLYRKVTNLYIQSVLPILRVHVKKKGMEKVPTDGRFMLVSNHSNDSDPIILLYAMPKSQLAFVSKKENSSMFVIGPMMHKLQCQLINRENDREALKTILKCIQILNEDRASIAVFPEGAIHDDLKFHRFRPGVFKIAQKTKVPIVVCTMKNTPKVIVNLKRWKRTDIELSVLQVIQPEEYEGLTTVEMANRIHKIMADDLGPELVAAD